MPCVEPKRAAWRLVTLSITVFALAGCGGMHADPADKAASASASATRDGDDDSSAPVSEGAKTNSAKPGGTKQAATGKTAPSSASGKSRSEAAPRLGPPGKSRNWAQVREQAAHRLVAANPNITYTGKVPDVLLAIPVFSIQLNGDGSIRYIDVMRYPHQARDTVEIAKAAMRRAAPFGDVSHLPKPWRFNETFLFNDQRKFKPLTLDR